MTCVIGLVKDDGTVVMGADSCWSQDHSKIIYTEEKVFFNANSDEFLIGYTGYIRTLQLIRHSFAPPKPPLLSKATKEDNEKYMCTTFIASLKELLELQKTDFAGLLIGFRGQLYEVEPSYGLGICEKNYSAIGSGGEAAFTSLCVLDICDKKYDKDKKKNNYDAKHDETSYEEYILRVILEAVAYVNVTVTAPFIIKSLPCKKKRKKA